MFLPLRDENPQLYIHLPYVTWGLIALNVVIFALMQLLPPTAEQAIDVGFGAVPALVTGRANIDPSLVHLPAPLTLISYMFLHGGYMHIIGNMLFLFVFGDNVEDAMGHVRFALFYLLCGVLAALAHVAIMPASQSTLIGASGSISAIIGAYLVLYPRVKVLVLAFKIIPLTLPVWTVLGAWVLTQLVNLFALGQDNVAWTAHVGGFIAGVVLVWVFKRRQQPAFSETSRLQVSVPQFPLPKRR